jgi:hypothetical protein
MKMGNIRSPWRYDAVASCALQSANPRQPAILHHASWAAVFPISQGGPVTPIAALTVDPETDLMGHKRNFAARYRKPQQSSSSAAL